MKNQRGSSTITIVILTPVVLAMIGFVVYAGRLAATEGDVRAAAHDAARAASLHHDDQLARDAARAVAQRDLTARDHSCRDLTVDTTWMRIGPDRAVQVTIRCRIDTTDLAGFRAPGSRTVTAEATEVLDRYVGANP